MYRTAAVIWLAGWAAFSIPWSSFTARPQVDNVSLVPFKARRLDQIRNFLYYVPAGAIGIGLGLGTVATVAGASALSGTAEVSQVFSTRRVPSTTDLTLNTGGALVGAGIALLARSRRLSPAIDA